ncbi:MAG: TIGR03905 family TSCPD domain-containing protein [Lentimicrobiaceae bacterium]|nr:TIGR03905 family TSCPD domain-containing protein [Lentimicrobiaceae bacterium]
MITKDIIFIPEGVCSQQIDISVVNDTIRSVVFTKGCPGNTLAVSHLIEGMHIDDAIAKLDGIMCREKPTSCPDQLARALKSMK